MVIVGIIMVVLGALLAIPILITLGIIAIIVGLILWFVPIGGTRRRWY
jgi:hypothetical protein